MSSNKKVVLCPKCNKEIDYIDNIISGMNYYPLRKTGNYGKPNFNGDDDICWYCCPNCHEEIASSHDDAVRLLNGETLELFC